MPDKTRFDFAHNAPMTDEEIRRVEALVNAEILDERADRGARDADRRGAEAGAMMLFGEKYGDEVRVLDIGSSRELCGGTHVARTGDIGLFKIVGEGGVAAGIRRVEAVDGRRRARYVQAQEATLARGRGGAQGAGRRGRGADRATARRRQAAEKELARAEGEAGRRAPATISRAARST